MLVLLQQHGVHQSLDRSVVGKDANHKGAPLDLFVDALEQVGAPDLLPVLRREVAEGQHVLAGLEHELCCPGKAFGQGADQVQIDGGAADGWFVTAEGSELVVWVLSDALSSTQLELM